MRVRILLIAIPPAGALLSGCLVAAAGAGAGGAVYITERDAEATIPAAVPTAEASAKRVLTDFQVKEKRTLREQGQNGNKVTIEGSLGDRDVTVAIQTAGTGSKVVVAAKKSPVTWDKDLAKRILEKIVAGAK